MDHFIEQFDFASLPMWLRLDEREAAFAASKTDDGFSKWHLSQLALLELQAAYAEHLLIESIDFELRGPMSLAHRQSIRVNPRDCAGRHVATCPSNIELSVEAKLDGLIDRSWPEAKTLILGTAISTRKLPVEAIGRALMGPALFDHWQGCQLASQAKRELEGATPEPKRAANPATRI